MRFAIKTMPERGEWAPLLAVWQEADQHDIFESAWTFDHFYPIFTTEPEPCFEGWTMLAAMAQATTRIRVGCLVTGVPYRHPAVLANMACTVDVLSGGRLELGLGAGWNEVEANAYGIPLGSITERFDRFDEACEVITSLLENDSTTYDGTYYQLTNARCLPKPIQQPHPPICIGGGGEKRTLKTAARWADHWNCPGGTAEEVAHKRDVLHRHCADIGRDPAEILTSVHVMDWPGNDVGTIVERAAAFQEMGIDLAVVYLYPPYDAKVVAPLAKALSALV